LPLFKTSKAPNATISINTGKDDFVLEETITGDILVTSEEEFDAKEIMVELRGVVKSKIEERSYSGDMDEADNPIEGVSRAIGFFAPKIFKKIKGKDTIDIPMYRAQTKVSEKLKITKGYSQQFPFQITIRPNVRTMIYLSRPGPGREWFLKGVVAVEGRPNIETKKDIKVSIPENFKEKAKTESQG